MNSQTNLLDHSEAKVLLYSRYLAIYLNVLSRSAIKKIYLFDLFCGEGIYEDGGKGSPIAALECIKNHYYANGEKCPNLFVTFNDSEKSKIDKEKYKIERVEGFAKNIFTPPNVKVGYSKIDYKDLVPKVIERTNKLASDERALIFIDPWGYKEIDPLELKGLLENGKTELLLFLPTYFMSRFANKSKKDLDYKGGEALRKFMGKLFNGLDKVPHIENQKKFIYLIQQQFKAYLGVEYVDSFKIERDNDNNWFCVFFFTNNKKGFHKMLEAKWSIDKKKGAEFKIGDEVKVEMFDEAQIIAYDQKVLEFLLRNEGATNHELVDFGLSHNFLPKHTKSELDKIKKERPIELISLDGKPASSYYLGNDERTVKIKIL
ncbi:MAG: hypothetical protein JWP69_1337 [Flaviaesturariibacter sp.]|nr:hypothetical protein [Flaviaesturariibacter sp.]